MSGSVFDAVVLLAADGLVAVGRVLGRLRRPCEAEERAAAFRGADALAEREAVQEVWENGELNGRGTATGDAVRGVPVLRVEHLHGALLDVPVVDPCECVCSSCLSGGHCDTASCAQIPDAFEPDELWPLPPNPAPDMTPEKWGFVGKCPNQGRMCNCTGECITPPKLDGMQLGERSAAVSPPAADNTTQADHLEAAWHYHKGAVGYAPMRSGPGGVEWFCEGCDWSGPTKQAHARHRFQVLADMKNATTRVEQQLSNPCVVDDCDFSWHTYEELNAHSRQMHLEPNPFPDGGFRYPGADDVGDFTWHHATTRVQEQLGGTA